MKAAAGRAILIGGLNLAALAYKAGLIDACHLFIAPIIVGGGNQSLPDNVRLELELLEERRFAGGMVHLRYRARHAKSRLTPPPAGGCDSPCFRNIAPLQRFSIFRSYPPQAPRARSIRLACLTEWAGRHVRARQMLPSARLQ